MCIINTSVHLHQYPSHILQHDPMIECFQCHEMVSMHEFRQHQEDKCGKRRKVDRLCRLCSVYKKKSISPWLVDFAIRRVDFVVYLPNGQVKFVLDFLNIF